VTDTPKAALSTLSPDAILKKKMAAINADLDAVAEQGYDPVPRHNQFCGIVGLRELA
jgi:hypothetical protein